MDEAEVPSEIPDVWDHPEDEEGGSEYRTGCFLEIRILTLDSPGEHVIYVGLPQS